MRDANERGNGAFEKRTKAIQGKKELRFAVAIVAVVVVVVVVGT